MVLTLRWVMLDITRYGGLKYEVQIPSGGVDSSRGEVELLALSMYVLISLIIK